MVAVGMCTTKLYTEMYAFAYTVSLFIYTFFVFYDSYGKQRLFLGAARLVAHSILCEVWAVCILYLPIRNGKLENKGS